MGQASVKDFVHAIMASGISGADTGDYGPRDGAPTGREPGGTSGAGAYQQAHRDPPSIAAIGGDAHYEAPELEKAQDIAFRQILCSLETLRTAAMNMHATLHAAEEAGLPTRTALEAIRLEHTDWAERLSEAQLIADLLAAANCRTRIDTLLMVDDPIASEKDRIGYEKGQGYLAYVAGKPIGACPYGPTEPAAASWRHGYLDARADARQE